METGECWRNLVEERGGLRKKERERERERRERETERRETTFIKDSS
jgi:hypothetical protein